MSTKYLPVREATASSPALKHAAVSPHDTNELTTWAKALFIGGGGTIAVVAAGESGTTGVSYTVPSGFILPIAARIVKSTGTTATNIVALFD